ncbi:hypothetical protein G7Y89_g14949 [Cudoniella acicularis]|uniref:Uncharacterized protein n=1 Tax=Cudoniella acicularis TaxID=354080 RepID=A0A8H4QWW6_9HELO|nr:hypothetical protein G7Y89_g14949 [Cudoniella acicularis]
MLPLPQLSETAGTFLQKIADATNAAAAKDEKLIRHLPLLVAPYGSMLTLYCGHSDMPTELHARLPSITAPETLKKLRREIRKNEKDGALTDETAARLIELIDGGQIALVFEF